MCTGFCTEARTRLRNISRQALAHLVLNLAFLLHGRDAKGFAGFDQGLEA